ncbi:transmembrane protein [Mycolicibacterium phlei]|jgi:hypothetical protein|uniref:Membrane protein n=1 Tax=Mycolicibacterium phlei DSM 43239 = CCUG 21000 TaxID=1226750 RepID=A0A5N5VG64_MYCPH|nr:hypothetical protein [Mycolicibacterium phlei]VEG11438.1 transmembrane protein [Mycobacteroides chelonae]AMO63342.1 hypothetical protein MPHLCCUG_04556 [Mycolicibacterium phlei]KAB7759797.1 membrane protein [Mycolicibacterium phlei DSM 43239 = CCUG 21000]KXW64162.1 membrane protein [Mycolicibacterium phlei DSM 43072]KXW68845.1 membrane protein [Mycolicibacterium phlei DSM 43239 = CCUG 21000]
MHETETLPGEPTQPYTPTFDTGEFEAPAPAPELPAPHAQPIVVPGDYQYLKRWLFALVLAAVWVPSAVSGWFLYDWWYQSLDKTAPVFVVLLFVIFSTVGGLLTAMAPRPAWSALALAFMSAPLAAVAGAAVLHGIYYCEWANRCLVGLIPY